MIVSRVALSTLLVSAPMGAFSATSSAFSYDPASDIGPAHWGELDIEGNQCDGEKNSPIAVVTQDCDRFEDYEFSMGSCTAADLSYSLTETGVKAAYPDTCEKPRVKIPGIEGEYEALQFHIHTSSEHTIDDQFFGAELHTVHAEVGGDRFAVVGMMIDPVADLDNDMFGHLLAGWQEDYDHREDECDFVGLGRGTRNLQGSEEVFSPYMLIPDGASYYHYDGGLTTPPCSEVVWWNLADKAVQISPRQYLQLTNQVLHYLHLAECKPGTYAGPAGSTSRPPQPLNGRTVERICATSASSNASLSFATLGAIAVAAATMFF